MAAGSILFPPGTGDALKWQAQVILDGVDVSENLTGTISIDAEEGAARIASFVLKPTFGALDISLWVGKSVEINYVTTFQNKEAVFLVFRGLVDMPTYDPLDRLVTFRCSDFMQKRIERMSRSALVKEVGGLWSPYLFNPIETNYEHFQERMSTQCASYDLDVHRVGKVTPWKIEGTPHFTFTENQIIDKTLQVDLASSREVTNQIYMTFQFRYPRVYQFTFEQSWMMDVPDSDVVQYGIPYPTLDVVKSSLDGVDWAYKAGAQINLKKYTIIDGRQVPYVNQDLVQSVVASRVKRWMQPVSEYSHCVLRAPQSIAAAGLQEQERNFSYDMGETGDHFTIVWDTMRDYYYPIDSAFARYLPFQQYTAKLPASAQDVVITTQRLPDNGEKTERYVTGNLTFKYVDCDELAVTNHCLHSNEFDQWLSPGATVKPNVKSGFYEDEAAADLVHFEDGGYLSQTIPVSPNTPYTFSIYAWAGPYDGGKPIWIAMKDNQSTGTGNDPDAPPDPVPGPDNISTSVVYLTGKPSNALTTLTTGKKATTITLTIGWWDGEKPTEGGAHYAYLERAMLVEGGKPAIYVDTKDTPVRGPTYRETFEDADICAKSIIKREMMESHRHNYVSFKTPLFPLLERFHYARVNTALVKATGKIFQVQHELDTFTGSATTSIRLALSKSMRTAVPDDVPFLPMDKALVGTATPPRVKSKFCTMYTYVGFCGTTYIGPGYDYIIQNNQVTPLRHAPYYGWQCNAGGGTVEGAPGDAVYGMWEDKFVCGTPQINAEHMGEKLASRYSEIDIAIPDDELDMVA